MLSCLEKQGVDLVFGLPGGAVIPLYDRLKNFELKHILMRHEQGAVHAADGYARATGKVGVCFATSGPGAANMMTGLGTAAMDSIPLVMISGQVARSLLGKDSFQEAYVTGMSDAVTKNSVMVTDAKQIPQVIADAFLIASSGRPGPVLVDIPKDVFQQNVENINLDAEPRERYRRKLKNSVITREQIRKVRFMLNEAKKPLIIIGGGVNTTDSVRKNILQVVRTLDVPISQTLMANGVIPDDDPHFVGMVGMHGTTDGNYAIQNCDLLLAVGMRFDDRVTSDTKRFSTKSKKIHVDIDSSEIGKNVQVDLPIVGDAEEFFELLANDCEDETLDHSAWRQEIADHYRPLRHGDAKTLPPMELYGVINDAIDENTIVVTDVGQHQMWAALFLHPKGPRRFITSGGLGTMGYGLPAAIGAQFGKRKDKVFLITGDGSFQMNLQELCIIKEFNVPVKILLMNNGYLGMVRQWQEMFNNANYAATTLDVGPDWEKLAAAYDIPYHCIEHLDDAKEKLPALLNSDGPEFIDCRINKFSNVYPMIPAGSSLDEIVGEFEDEA
ncbi:MAG: biosynthetic-type acetolactate synthase large subunit [Peptococcaceae bacterium]|nr:biosynthetic-type acetolactate synthase large subunit [Peptococcaceae bacterium]